MKKFILSALLALVYLLYLCPRPQATLPTAYAQSDASAPTATAGGFACVLESDTFFYAQADEKTGLFLLPVSYYVKIIEVSPTFCKVEYLYDDTHVQKLVGYVKSSALTFVDYVPKRPYLYKLFDLRYTLDNGASTSSDVLGEITLTCAYYGDYVIGSQTYCYVLRDDVFGYVPKPTHLSIEQNTEYADWLAAQQPTSPEQPPLDSQNETPASSSPAQIAFLIAVCLLVPILAAFLLRSQKRQPYDEELM